jgi:hypothetical protein
MKKIILIAIAFLSLQISAQDKSVYQDVRKLINETQKAVSVKKGQKIDTAYYRTLFLPTARFTVVGEENGKTLHETMTLDEFLTSLTDEYYTNGYFETSKGHIVEEYKGIAHSIQSFYGKDSEGEEGWGVGSQQLIYSDGRWWIVNMIWTMSPKGKDGIPNKYLKN